MSRHAHFNAGQVTPPVEKAEEETMTVDGQATPAVEEQEPIPFSRLVLVPVQALSSSMKAS